MKARVRQFQLCYNEIIKRETMTDSKEGKKKGHHHHHSHHHQEERYKRNDEECRKECRRQNNYECCCGDAHLTQPVGRPGSQSLSLVRTLGSPHGRK